MKKQKIISVVLLGSMLFANNLLEAKNLKQSDAYFNKVYKNENENKNKKMKYFFGSLISLFGIGGGIYCTNKKCSKNDKKEHSLDIPRVNNIENKILNFDINNQNINNQNKKLITPSTNEINSQVIKKQIKLNDEKNDTLGVNSQNKILTKLNEDAEPKSIKKLMKLNGNNGKNKSLDSNVNNDQHKTLIKPNKDEIKLKALQNLSSKEVLAKKKMIIDCINTKLESDIGEDIYNILRSIYLDYNLYDIENDDDIANKLVSKVDGGGCVAIEGRTSVFGVLTTRLWDYSSNDTGNTTRNALKRLVKDCYNSLLFSDKEISSARVSLTAWDYIVLEVGTRYGADQLGIYIFDSGNIRIELRSEEEYNIDNINLKIGCKLTNELLEFIKGKSGS